MTQSLLWFEEEEYRQEYIAGWFSDAVNLKRTDNMKRYREKLIDIMNKKIAGEKLTEKQKDLINYFSGEIDKTTLVEGTFKLMKGQQKEKQDEIKKEIIDKRKFTKVKNKNYEIADKKAIGYTKGIESRVFVEKFLYKGEVQIRARNKKGHFASFIKEE